VLYLANKEGGAHVDPTDPEPALKTLEEDNSLGWTHSDPWIGQDVAMLNGPVLPSIRQIAYELHQALQPIANATLSPTGGS
jgi:hypothetical protein